MPWKTTLTLVVFAALVLLPQVAPALKNYKSLDPHDIPLVWDLPLPKLAVFGNRSSSATGANGPGMDDLRSNRLTVLAPKNLIDPTHELDHFYAALLAGKTTRVLHYGDSPTTADLITADARAMLQKEFGDAGTGFRADRAAMGLVQPSRRGDGRLFQLEDRYRRIHGIEGWLVRSGRCDLSRKRWSRGALDAQGRAASKCGHFVSRPAGRRLVLRRSG